MFLRKIKRLFGIKTYYTLEQIKRKNYIIIDNYVLDVSCFLKQHPGGEHTLKYYMGKDATNRFYKIHKPETFHYMKRFIIGYLNKECVCKQCTCDLNCKECMCKMCECKTCQKGITCVCKKCECQEYKMC